MYLVGMMTAQYRCLLLFCCLLFVTCGFSFPGNPENNKLKQLAAEARRFTKNNGYNTGTCFLLDLSISSGKSRFFVYDLAKDSVLEQGLVTHGHCYDTHSNKVRFSNTPGCGCSSSGKYKLGNKYNGRFGMAYKLIGLDSTNSNAVKRFVVMHAHTCVPDKEVYPQEICRSEGCTTVSPAFLKKLDARIHRSPKPMLLWVFN
jgi:hypothetical protein